MISLFETGPLEILMQRGRELPDVLTHIFPGVRFFSRQVEGSLVYCLWYTTLEIPLTREQMIELHMQCIVRQTIVSWSFNGQLATIEL